jgi:hypothetical protein
MKQTHAQPEGFWDAMLSRQPKRVLAAFSSLDTPSQKIILAHLRIMVSEAGWQPEQRKSAKIALKALENHMPQDE